MDSPAGLAGSPALPRWQPTAPRPAAPGAPGLAPGFRVIGEGLAVAPTVSVVVPAKNEARNLAHVFSSIPPWVDEVVLVDGSSADDTVAEARRLLPAVRIIAQQGRGKGGALREGLSAARGDIIVMLDADGSTDGAEIPRFVSALTAGADFVKGSRFASGGGSDDITATRLAGNRILSALVNLLFRTRYTDLCYGYNALWARHVPTLALDCDGFEVETMMHIRAAQAGLHVHEVPSREHPRLHGHSNLRTIPDGWRIARVIMRERLSARDQKPKRPTDAERAIAVPLVGTPIAEAPVAACGQGAEISLLSRLRRIGSKP
jgi:glycosyltransferase involved in cell wall biosynthesis